MNKTLLKDAVHKLHELSLLEPHQTYAQNNAVLQFDALLSTAKEFYPERVDIQCMAFFSSEGESVFIVRQSDLKDALVRLVHAIDLRPTNSATETLAEIRLPEDTPADVRADFDELISATSSELTKTSLLLSGSIAESLLINRHPDDSERGPGLAKLVSLAREQRLFGRDTLRNLETLVEYRDLIHPRAEKRNLTIRNKARASAAIIALRLLCSELEDLSVRFDR